MVLAVGATAEVVMMAAAVYCRSRRRGGRQPVGVQTVQESPDGRSGPSRVI